MGLPPQSIHLLGGFHFANIDGDMRSLAPKAAQQFGQSAANRGADNSDD